MAGSRRTSTNRGTQSRNAGSRAGGRAAPPPRRGSGNGPLPGLIAIVLIGAVAVFFILRGRGEKEGTPTPPANQPAASVGTTPTGGSPKRPVERPKKPPTEPSAAARDRIEATASRLQDIANRAEALYNESVAARANGDEVGWQDLLAEARNTSKDGLEIWNEEIVSALPTNEDYDGEQAAAYWLQKNAEWISKPQRPYRKIEEVMSKMKAAARR